MALIAQPKTARRAQLSGLGAHVCFVPCHHVLAQLELSRYIADGFVVHGGFDFRPLRVLANLTGRHSISLSSARVALVRVEGQRGWARRWPALTASRRCAALCWPMGARLCPAAHDTHLARHRPPSSFLGLFQSRQRMDF